MAKSSNIRILKSKKLSPDLIMLAEIYKAEQSGEPICFKELVEKFEGKITRGRLSIADDRLCDLGLVYTKWVLKDGLWRTCYFVYPEASKIARETQSYLGESNGNSA